MNRAYSLFEVKAVDEDARVLEGIATTPQTDRMGDVVEPKGAAFTLPIPFLWQHKHDSPIGHVTQAKVTDDGILVRVQIEKDDEPGPLKDLLDKAWRSIRKGLVRGLSIGFNPVDEEPIKGSFGFRFTKWDWLELSAVTIPANAGATIQAVKSFDSAPADLGTALPIEKKNPGSSGPVKLTKTREKTVNITEQIRSFEAERAAKDAQRTDLMTKAGEKGETLDAAAAEQYDTLEQEIEAIDKHLVRLRKLERSNATAAVPVAAKTQAEATGSRGGLSGIKVPVKADAGIRFARLAKCIGLAKGLNPHAAAIAANAFGEDAELNLFIKGAVDAGSVAHTTWAGNLVGDETSLFADFADFLRPQTIIGRFGSGGIPSLRRIPFRVPLISQTAGGAAYWTPEGLGKGLTSFAFARTTLEPLKVANITVATMELLRDSSPSAEGILRDQLAAALRERLDIDFIDPDKAANTPTGSPASITNGITPIPSSGNTAADVRVDIKAAMESFIAANNAPSTGVWIMPATTALGLSLLYNANGVQEFPGISLAGGTLFGIPVITSEYVPADSDGAIVALVNASDIYLGDDGGVRIDVSREASLLMDTAPTNQASVDTPAASSVVSMFQTNSVAFLAERTINWARRRASGVAVISDVNWGDGA
jgi:HK97 family phage major capsid protein/HK97 family phage prohead protease